MVVVKEKAIFKAMPKRDFRSTDILLPVVPYTTIWHLHMYLVRNKSYWFVIFGFVTIWKKPAIQIYKLHVRKHKTCTTSVALWLTQLSFVWWFIYQGHFANMASDWIEGVLQFSKNEYVVRSDSVTSSDTRKKVDNVSIKIWRLSEFWNICKNFVHQRYILLSQNMFSEKDYLI